MLRLADLEQSKNAVLHSLGAAGSQELYGHAIDEFMGWYCSEPRLHLTELSSFATCPLFCHLAGGEQIQFLLGHASRKSRLGLLPPSRLIGTNPVSSSDRLSPISGQTTTRFHKCQRRNRGSGDAVRLLHSWRSQNLLCSTPPAKSCDLHSRLRLGQRPLTSKRTGFAVALMFGS